MMGVLPPVVAHLMADITGFTAGMQAAGKEVQGLNGMSATGFASMGKAAMGVGAVMAGAALLVGVTTVKMASDFNAQMERIHTQAGASQTDVEGLKNKVLALAGTVGQGPGKLAEALYHVESAFQGIKQNDAMKILSDGAKLATISGANLDDTIYGLSSVMNTFGAKAQDSAKWAAYFNSVVGAGDMRMQDFNKAVGTGFLDTAQAFGVSAQSAGAALAFMTDRGQHADAAATHLRMSMALMAAPSAKATKILEGLGLTSTEVARTHSLLDGALQKSQITYSQLGSDLMKPDGFYVALKHLKSGLMATGMSAGAAAATLSHAFGGGKSDATILSMLNNLDTLKNKYAAVGKGMGSMGESWAKAQEQFSVKVDKAKASAEAFGIQIGEVLLPYAMKFIDWLSKSVTWLTQHAQAAKYAAIAVGVTLVAGLALLTAGFIALAVSTVELWGPIFLIIVAVVAVVAGLFWLWANWKTVWGWVTQHANSVWQWLKKTWQAISADVHNVWSQIIANIKGFWSDIASWFAGAWHTVTDPIVNAWNHVRDFTVTAWTAISNWFKQWWPLLLVIFSFPLAVLVALWNHFHEAVWKATVTAWNAVSKFMSTLWAGIVVVAKTVWELFYRRVIDPILRLYKDAVSVLTAIGRFIAGVWNSITSATSSAWNGIYNTVARWLGNIMRPVNSFGSSLSSSITGAFNSVLKWLGGVGSWFSGIGVAIVNGIVSGVGSASGALFGSLENLASNALSSAKSFLGINSPSKVFADNIGRAIPEGIALGVRQHTHLAHAAVAAMSGALGSVGLGSSGFAVSGASSRGGGDSTLNLSLTSIATVDGKQLFATVQQHSLKYQKRNGKQAFAIPTGTI